ncbi:MAG: S1C family serine protease [Fimbriimonadales bacterium]|nr:S1C family serine protease [Fimbriimonadales bacterium]
MLQVWTLASIVWGLGLQAEAPPLETQSDPPRSARTVTPEARIFSKAKPAVVTVLCGASKGSGFLFDSSGLILTNAHVVRSLAAPRLKTLTGRMYGASLVAMHEKADVAVLWANPKVFEGVECLPLAKPEDEPPFEGERILAIGSPLNQELIVTSGIVSKTTSDAILSDVNINHGNSGGPVLNLDGKVVGIATFLDPGGNGPGLSGIIRIEVAQPAIERARRAQEGKSPPDAKELPQPRSLEIPEEELNAQSATLKRKEAPFLKAPRNFRTYVETPFIAQKAVLEELAALQREWKRTVGRRYKNAQPPSFTPPTSAFWWKYVGGIRKPTVVLKVIPWPMEKADSQWWTILGALGGVPNTDREFEFRDDISRIEVEVNGRRIEPYEFVRVLHEEFFETAGVSLKDKAFGAVLQLDPLIFQPGNKIVLQVWKNDRKEPDTVRIPEWLQKEVWTPFEPWFRRLPPEERTIAYRD